MVAKSTQRTDNESHKFVNNSSNEVAVNTVSEITNKAANPVPVEIVDGTIGANFSLFGEVVGVASSAVGTVLTYTVPADTTLTLKNIQVSGTNIAQFEVKIEGDVVFRSRTYWGNFDSNLNVGGIEVLENETIEVEVLNFRPDVADFNATLLGLV